MEHRTQYTDQQATGHRATARVGSRYSTVQDITQSREGMRDVDATQAILSRVSYTRSRDPRRQSDSVAYPDLVCSLRMLPAEATGWLCLEERSEERTKFRKVLCPTPLKSLAATHDCLNHVVTRNFPRFLGPFSFAHGYAGAGQGPEGRVAGVRIGVLRATVQWLDALQVASLVWNTMFCLSLRGFECICDSGVVVLTLAVGIRVLERRYYPCHFLSHASPERSSS